MLYCTLILLEDLAFVNSQKREKIEIKYLLRLLRRTFFRRVLPPPVSLHLVFALCFLGYLILKSCSANHSSVLCPAAPSARPLWVKVTGCHRGQRPRACSAASAELLLRGLRSI